MFMLAHKKVDDVDRCEQSVCIGGYAGVVLPLSSLCLNLIETPRNTASGGSLKQYKNFDINHVLTTLFLMYTEVDTTYILHQYIQCWSGIN